MGTTVKAPTAQKTVNARKAAEMISDAIGRPVTPKAVRTVARDILAAYQDDKYTQHKYDAKTVTVLKRHFLAKTARRQASLEADLAQPES